MIIVQPSAELEWITPNAEQMIERAGRTAYKSEDKITGESAEAFIRKIMKAGHLSVLEHASASFRFVCDRGVTHEMVRHRIAAYTQESTRYCSYGKEKFGGQIRVIEPPFSAKDPAKRAEVRRHWEAAVREAELRYLKMLELGEKPQIARSVLPQCLKTEIVMTANLREWLWVFSLRTSDNPRAHPQIQEVMDQAREILRKEVPTIFGNPDS